MSAPKNLGRNHHPSGDVAAGQHYMQANAYRTVWEVRDRLNVAGGILHVRLARVDDPTVMKTVSMGALLDEAFFRRVDDREDDGRPSGRVRAAKGEVPRSSTTPRGNAWKDGRAASSIEGAASRLRRYLGGYGGRRRQVSADPEEA